MPLETKVPTDMATPEGIKFLKVLTKPLERGKENNNGMLRHLLDEEVILFFAAVYCYSLGFKALLANPRYMGLQ